jgi:L-seryl-tRNA(Ser) seleniumtransferase
MKKSKGSMVHGLEVKEHQALLSAQNVQKRGMVVSQKDKASSQGLLSQLPSIDRLINAQALQDTAKAFGLTLLTQVCKEVLADIRQNLKMKIDLETENSIKIPDELEIVSRIQIACAHKMALQFKSVHNMTGTVIHTNLGRSVLADVAVKALGEAGKHPLNLEYDLSSGERGERDHFLEELICTITGAEAATFVNNNAAAVLLTLAALAHDREVVISRGELVEIGGSFRMPDVMKSAGAHMVEVGTTNRTHLKDYEKALSERTSVLMKIHTSNYQVQGFTQSVSEAELAPLAEQHQITLVSDLGSGSLIEMGKYGLPHEPTPQEMLKAGCHVVTFSGDKLLGGPQAGIIVGRKREIDLIRNYPMKRALRLSKLPVVALEATLKLYLRPESLVRHLPTLRWLARSQEVIKDTAQIILNAFEKALTPHYKVELCAMRSQIGSGSLPLDTMDSFGLAIKPMVEGNKGVGSALIRLSKSLRSLSKPIIGRVEKNMLLLDCRCIDDALSLAQEIACLEIHGS